MVAKSEALAQWGGQHAGTGRRTDEREAFDRDLVRLGIRAAVHNDVDAKIFHRGIEKFFDHAAEAMDLVDEQNVAGLQRRQDADQVLRLVERRPRRRAQGAAEIPRDQRRERRLSEPGGTVEQDVLERFVTPFRCVDRDH